MSLPKRKVPFVSSPSPFEMRLLRPADCDGGQISQTQYWQDRSTLSLPALFMVKNMKATMSATTMAMVTIREPANDVERRRERNDAVRRQSAM
jgi:hypothetical protein